MVIWTDKAVFNIQEFIQNARADTENTARNYMNKLVDYVESLDNMMQMGKKYEAPFTNYEIRQLVYRSHKIYYTINKEDVVILAVLHSKLDINKALKNILK